MSLLPILLQGALGIFGRALDRKASQRDQMDYWVRHRKASEKAGFNPLATLGHTPQVAGLGMSSALSEAGLLLADSLAQRPMRELQLEEQRLRNAELTKRVAQLTLQPKIGGAFGGGDVPHSSTDLVAGDGVATLAKSGVSASSDRLPRLAPDRLTNKTAVTDTAGLLVINNTLTGGDVIVPGDSEPWGIDEMLTAGVIGFPQVVYHQSPFISDGGRLTSFEKAQQSKHAEKGQQYLLSLHKPRRRPLSVMLKAPFSWRFQ